MDVMQERASESQAHHRLWYPLIVQADDPPQSHTVQLLLPPHLEVRIMPEVGVVGVKLKTGVTLEVGITFKSQTHHRLQYPLIA